MPVVAPLCRSFEGPDYAIPNGPGGDDAFFKRYTDGILKGNTTGPVLLTAHPLGVGGKIEGLNRTIAFLKNSGYNFTTVSSHRQGWFRGLFTTKLGYCLGSLKPS
jgi:hypothetical protein